MAVGMLGHRESDNKRRLRKTQSALTVLGKHQNASQTQQKGEQSMRDAQTAAAVAFETANCHVSPLSKDSDLIRRRSSRHLASSAGYHLARKRSYAGEFADRDALRRTMRHTEPLTRSNRKSHSLSHRRSGLTVQLCGKSSKRNIWTNPRTTECSGIVSSRDQSPSVERCDYLSSVRQNPGQFLALPSKEVQKGPDCSTNQAPCLSIIQRLHDGNGLAEARDEELREHQVHSIRQLRSIVSTSFRSQLCKNQTDTDKPKSVLPENRMPGGFSSNNQLQSQRTHVTESMRSIPNSFRRFCRRTFRGRVDRSEDTQWGRASPEDCINKEANESDNLENVREIVPEDVIFAQNPVPSEPPVPPPHLDLSSFNRICGRQSLQSVGSTLQTCAHDQSNITSWSSTSSDETVVKRHRGLYGRVLSSQIGNDSDSSNNIDTYHKGSRSGNSYLVIPERKSSKVMSKLPSLNAQRRISLFLKQISGIGASNQGSEEVDPNMYVPTESPLAESREPQIKVSRQQPSVHGAQSIRLITPTTGNQNETANLLCEIRPDVTSPSIYSNASADSSRQSRIAISPDFQQLERPLGTATISGSKSVTRWNLPNQRKGSAENAPNTSNDWRLWASRKVAGLGTETPHIHAGSRIRSLSRECNTDIANFQSLQPGSEPLVQKRAETLPSEKPEFLHARDGLRGLEIRTDNHPPRFEVSRAINSKAKTTHELADGLLASLDKDRIPPLGLKSSNTGAESLLGRENGSRSAKRASSCLGKESFATFVTPERHKFDDSRTVSPISENFIRNIQRGPYAPPRLGSPGDEPYLTKSRIGLRNYARNESENIPPGLGSQIFDTKSSTQSARPLDASRQYSIAFL